VIQARHPLGVYGDQPGPRAEPGLIAAALDAGDEAGRSRRLARPGAHPRPRVGRGRGRAGRACRKGCQDR